MRTKIDLRRSGKRGIKENARTKNGFVSTITSTKDYDCPRIMTVNMRFFSTHTCSSSPRGDFTSFFRPIRDPFMILRGPRKPNRRRGDTTVLLLLLSWLLLILSEEADKLLNGSSTEDAAALVDVGEGEGEVLA